MIEETNSIDLTLTGNRVTNIMKCFSYHKTLPPSSFFSFFFFFSRWSVIASVPLWCQVRVVGVRYFLEVIVSGEEDRKKLVWILSDGGTKRERERVGETETEKKGEGGKNDRCSYYITHNRTFYDTNSFPLPQFSPSLPRFFGSAKICSFNPGRGEGSIHWGNQRNGRVVGVIPSGSCFRWGSLMWS